MIVYRLFLQTGQKLTRKAETLISEAVHNISDPMYLPKFKSNLNLFHEGHFMGSWDALWHLIWILYYFSQFFQQFHIKYVRNLASF